MAVTFPPNPTVGQTVTDPVTGAVWVWNGTAWVAQGSAGAGAYLPLSGGTLTGPLNTNSPITLTGAGANGIITAPQVNLQTLDFPMPTVAGAVGCIPYNATYNGTNWVYTANGPAFLIAMNSSGSAQLIFMSAPSGTAGATITWSTAMSLGPGQQVAQNRAFQPGSTQLTSGYNVTSTTGVMLGLGNYFLFTPKVSGLASISGKLNIGLTAGNSVNFTVNYGTGTPPAQGGTPAGNPITGINNSFTAPSNSSQAGLFDCAGFVSGLTIGTQYWFDFRVWVSGGSCGCSYTSIAIMEV